MRRSKEWLYIQKTLPTSFPNSQFNAVYSSLTEIDQLEAWLLSLDNETYDKIDPRIDIKKDMPVSTGDAIADQWEREFWESQRKQVSNGGSKGNITG